MAIESPYTKGFSNAVAPQMGFPSSGEMQQKSSPGLPPQRQQAPFGNYQPPAQAQQPQQQRSPTAVGAGVQPVLGGQAAQGAQYQTKTQELPPQVASLLRSHQVMNGVLAARMQQRSQPIQMPGANYALPGGGIPGAPGAQPDPKIPGGVPSPYGQQAPPAANTPPPSQMQPVPAIPAQQAQPQPPAAPALPAAMPASQGPQPGQTAPVQQGAQVPSPFAKPGAGQSGESKQWATAAGGAGGLQPTSGGPQYANESERYRAEAEAKMKEVEATFAEGGALDKAQTMALQQLFQQQESQLQQMMAESGYGLGAAANPQMAALVGKKSEALIDQKGKLALMQADAKYKVAQQLAQFYGSEWLHKFEVENRKIQTWTQAMQTAKQNGMVIGTPEFNESVRQALIQAGFDPNDPMVTALAGAPGKPARDMTLEERYRSGQSLLTDANGNSVEGGL